MAGEPCTICYDFVGSGITETSLDVEFTPADGSVGVEVSVADHCVTITIPETAKFVLISDDSNKSQPLDRPVAQS